MSDDGSAESAPVLRVVRGEPDAVELAAVTAVVVGLSTAVAPPEPPRRSSRWADRAALVRAPLTSGAGAWRASGLPR